MLGNFKFIENQNIDLSLFSLNKGNLILRREDLIHPFVSGNKFRKLKYNLLKAKELKAYNWEIYNLKSSYKQVGPQRPTCLLISGGYETGPLPMLRAVKTSIQY